MSLHFVEFFDCPVMHSGCNGDMMLASLKMKLNKKTLGYILGCNTFKTYL